MKATLAIIAGTTLLATVLCTKKGMEGNASINKGSSFNVKAQSGLYSAKEFCNLKINLQNSMFLQSKRFLIKCYFMLLWLQKSER